jgi:hypothetical protein
VRENFVIPTAPSIKSQNRPWLIPHTQFPIQYATSSCRIAFHLTYTALVSNLNGILLCKLAGPSQNRKVSRFTVCESLACSNPAVLPLQAVGFRSAPNLLMKQLGQREEG